MDPINYIRQVQNPMDSLMQGYSMRQQHESHDAMLKLDQQRAATAAQNADLRSQELTLKQDKAKQAKAAAAEAFKVFTDPNTTADDLLGLGIKYPSLVQGIKPAYDAMAQDE